ncbi:MAG: hypothetical protein MRY57_00320 [Candidatus Pacebacteria bacterium]|nr:hypothetical protein [Candidatus Paceibacterota bacterium]
MNNHDFNILNQLVQEQKSLWRIEEHYLPESKNADDKKLWTKLRNQKRKNIDELSKMAKKCLK